jgi:hypothetical protein
VLFRSVLFAQDANPEVTQRATALLQKGVAFQTILKELSLRLSPSYLIPWSRWITPKVSGVLKKRFDTRFFVSVMPLGQTALHDNYEATESLWLSPKQALEQYWNRSIELAPPQIMSLVHLARHTSVQSVLDQAYGQTPPLIEPEPFEDAQGRGLCSPGDACHSISQRALPGPTRMLYQNQRYEPAGGLQALFD